MMSPRVWLGWWLVWGAIALLSYGCNTTKPGDSSSSKKADMVVEDEAYILPPLSTFEALSPEITTDLAGKCSAAGLTLGTLKQTTGNGRKSLWASFKGAAGDRPQVIQAFTVLGHNFADLARVVVSFPGSGTTQYWVSTGTHVEQFLGIDLKPGSNPLPEDEFWKALSHDVTFAPPAEATPKPETTRVKTVER